MSVDIGIENSLISSIKDTLDDRSGHGLDHVLRVRTLALLFADSEGADPDIVELASLLHDVDDYKLVGTNKSQELNNAKRFLENAGIGSKAYETILQIIRTIGFSKRLEGVRPSTIEGMVVSDADMCDAIGAEGILRVHKYGISRQIPFFNKLLVPEVNNLSADGYRNNPSKHSVQHFFDKLLRVPSMMLTETGRAEAKRRQAIMIDFLKELFREESSKDWSEFLAPYLKNDPKVLPNVAL